MFNINKCVKVKLTDFGRVQHCKDHYEFYNQRGLPAREYHPPVEDKDGYSTWQLWHLMETFGKYCSLGSKLPFEADIIICTE